MIQMFTIKSIKPDNMSHSITKQTKNPQDFVIVIKGLSMGYSGVPSVIRASL